MFGPTHHLRELSAVIAASSAADGGSNREGFDAVGGCEYAAHLVFMEIRERHGEQEARRIFAKFMEPSDSRKAEIKTEAMLDATDMMMADMEDEDGSKKKGYTIAQIARWRAEHNKTLPSEEQRGPGGTDAPSLDHYIRLKLREREQGRNKELLDHVERMRLNGFSIREIARRCAEQNKNLPPDQQHGAGDTDAETLNTHIHRLIKERRRKASPPKR
jgi:hypothetical protein